MSPNGRSAWRVARLENGFSKTDEIMNTKTNMIWSKSLAVLALSCALANTALGQGAVQLLWDKPADITYGTMLSANQLNARAVNASGQDVSGTGEIRYFWRAPEATAREVASGDPKRLASYLSDNGYKIGDNIDRDSDAGGVQPFDWLFLDAGNNQVLTAVFTSGSSASLTATVNINVRKAPLSAVPATVSRNFGEENFIGYETGRLPTYPSNRFLFMLERDDNNNPIDGNGRQIDARGNILNTDGTSSNNQSDNIIFELSANGNRILAADDDANTPIENRQGGFLEIPFVIEGSVPHYRVTGAPVIFSGFVRGENYQKLVTNTHDVASQTEQNNPDTLISELLELGVADDNGNDIFRAAPVGTTGVISITTVPEFKNYELTNAAVANLTVKRAEIKFVGKSFTGGDSKVYGDEIDGRVLNGNEMILNLEIIKTGDFSLNNNFRLGEAFIERLISATTPGLAADANVGTYQNFLFVDTSSLGGVTAFLNNYDINLTSGEVNVVPREIDIAANDASKIYGRGNPTLTINVENPARHHIRAASVDNYIDPVHSNNDGNRGNIYTLGQLRSSGIFQSTPVAWTNARITSNVGTHAINITAAATPNYVIRDIIRGALQIRRADLVLEVGNYSSVRGQPLATPSVVPHGILPFDTLSNILTNDPQFAFYTPPVITPGLHPDTPTPVPVNSVRNAAPGTVFLIEISNKALVRAVNYNVFFNDGLGSYDGFGDISGGPSDELGEVDGKGFRMFNPEYVADILPGPSNRKWLSGANDIGQYTVNDRGVVINWNIPQQRTFGYLLGPGRDDPGLINAEFINPERGLPVSDPANGPAQMIEGVHYRVTYSANQGGELIKQTGTDLGEGVGNERYLLLPVGTHAIKVSFEVMQIPMTTDLNGLPVPAINFGGAETTRNVTINPRPVRIVADDYSITFQENVPNNRSFTYRLESGAAAAYYDRGIRLDGNPINDGASNSQISNSGVFAANEINDDNVLFTTSATSTSNAGEYPLSVSRLSGSNLALTYVDGKFTINKKPTALTWEGNLAAITYGTPLGDAQLYATSPLNVEGSVSYNRVPGVILNAGNHNIEAQFVSTNPNFDNSPKITKQITIRKKALTVQAQNASKVFGDNNPDFQRTADSLTGLIPQDVGSITLSFRTAANAKSPVGSYSIEPVVTDTANKLNNYEVTVGSATLRITRRSITITAADRSMETETNPVPFLNDFIQGGRVHSELDGNARPNHRVIISNLAPFHAINNAKNNENKGDGFPRLAALFPNLNLTTTATVSSPNGTSFPIRIASVGQTGGFVEGARVEGNYNISVADGTLSVTDKKPILNWNNITLMYGQSISRSGAKRADWGKDTRTQDANIFDASAEIPDSSANPNEGTFDYRIKDGQGELLDGIMFPIGKRDLVVTYTPPASATDYGPTTKEVTLEVRKRPLNITILDQSNVYGSIDLNFRARYGEIQRAGESNGDYNNRQAKSPNRLVNEDTPENLDQQLVLFSNVTEESGAGTYYIAVAQTAEDSNYNIRTVYGSQILKDGITRNPNSGAELANVGINIDGIGAPVSFVRETGKQQTFNTGSDRASVPVNYPLGTSDEDVNTSGPVEFHAGKLTVTKAPLTITADDLVKDVMTSNPPFSATAAPDQLRNEDTLEELLKTPLIFASEVDMETPIGSFPISVTGGSSDNYVITHRPGTFTVQPPEAPVVWAPSPSVIVYGTALSLEQLNATSEISGTFDYSENPAGMVLSAGTHTLMGTFTPNDLVTHRVTPITANVQVDPAPLTITANNAARGFSETNPAFTVSFGGLVNGDTPAVLTSPVVISTDGQDGVDAGDYALVPSGAEADNYMVMFVPGTLTINKDPAQISLSNLLHDADGTPKMAEVSVVPEGVVVDITYNGMSEAPVDVGTYEVRAVANDTNYEGFAVETMIIRGTASVVFGDLLHIYDGTAKQASIETEPFGISTSVTYNSVPDLPVNAGTYEVRAIIEDTLYSGFGIGVLEIQQMAAEVSLVAESLSQPVNELTGVMVTTVPEGLDVDIFYGDSLNLPTQIGSVAVRAVINEPNYVGSVSGVLEVGRATQSITTIPSPEYTIAGSPLNIGLFATASSELPVTFSVSSGEATVDGNLLTVTQPGEIVIVANQAGNDYYAPEETTFTISVVGQGVALDAPELSLGGISDAGIILNISGSPGAMVSVMSSETLGGAFTEVGMVTLDASGNGSITIPMTNPAAYFRVANQ